MNRSALAGMLGSQAAGFPSQAAAGRQRQRASPALDHTAERGVCNERLPILRPFCSPNDGLRRGSGKAPPGTPASEKNTLSVVPRGCWWEFLAFARTLEHSWLSCQPFPIVSRSPTASRLQSYPAQEFPEDESFIASGAQQHPLLILRGLWDWKCLFYPTTHFQRKKVTPADQA